MVEAALERKRNFLAVAAGSARATAGCRWGRAGPKKELKLKERKKISFCS